MKPGLPTEPALVGRDSEIEQLLHHFDSASNGRGTTVFICGEAGVGKTRLVNEFLTRAKKKGAEILCGWCLSEATVPYFPFTEAFNTYMSTTSHAKAKSTVTDQLGITGWLRGTGIAEEHKPLGITGWLKGTGLTKESQELFSTPEIERDKTFEAVARVLVQLSGQKPLVLFVDDLHWADQLSLALIHYLSRKCRHSRLLIIATYRPEEIIPAEERRLHPLEETIFSMSREDLLTKMELKRLKRNDLSELVTSIFPASVDEAFVERLYKETEGNPLFVIETLNLFVDEGFLSEKEGQWILMTPTEKMGIPSKVHEVITRRIARLGREERKLVDLAAVSGFSFHPDTLSRTLALDTADVLRTLVEVERRHKLIRSTNSTFEFAHHKIRETIYADLPTELRRIYHLKTADCLEKDLTEKASDGYLADIALHYVEAGALEKAFQYLLKLGERAVDIYANMQAIEHLDKALEAAQKSPNLAASENLAKIYKLRGRAWLGQGKTAKAIDDLNSLLPIVTSIGDESMIAEAHYLMGYAFALAGAMDKAKLHLTRAIEIARKIGSRLIEGRSLSSLGYVLRWNDDTMEEGIIRLEESSKICKEIGDKVANARNRTWIGAHYNWKGEFNLAQENINEALALAEEAGDNFQMLWALSILGWVFAGKGEYNDAILTLQRCLQMTREWGMGGYSAGISLTVLGWIYRDLCNIELALQHHHDALGTDGRGAALVDLGMDYLCKNDYENAEKYFREARRLLPEHRIAQNRMGTRVLLGFGETLLAKSDYLQALKSTDEALTASRKEGAKKYIAKSLKLKAEVLAKMGEIEEAVELMENSLKLAQEIDNPPLLWQIHYSLGLLLEKQGNLQKANEHHSEAIAVLEETASKLKDTALKNILLTAPQTKAIQDAYARTKPTS